MEDFTHTGTVLLAGVAVLIAIYVFGFGGRRRYKNLPPGPSGYPIVGYVPWLKPRFYLAMQKLMNRYGDVVQFYLGSQRVILLNTCEAIKEAFTVKGENFGGRMQAMVRPEIRNTGILIAEGSLWQTHRRFSLKVLRDFGFGRNLSEQHIVEEMQHLKTVFDTKLGEEIDSNELLTRSIGNVICRLTMGERPGFDDKDFDPIINGIRDNMRAPIFLRLIGLIFPAVNQFKFIANFFPAIKHRRQNMDNAQDYIRGKIASHKADFNADKEADDLIDAYLLEQNRLSELGEEHTFTDHQLMRVILELFIAGADTTSSTLTWLFMFMAHKPEIQERVHREIVEKIGLDRSPSMKDRREMPYTSAVIDEVQRFASIVPQPGHRNFREDTVMGFTVPEGTEVKANIYGIHHDPRLWKHPDDFYPEHFLNSHGEYTPNEQLIPFLIGKRSCLGEALAKMEMFLFFVGLQQAYTVRLAEADKGHMEEILLGVDGIVRSPGPHSVIFTRRT